MAKFTLSCVHNMAPLQIFGDGLKLINGNWIKLVRFFQITEYFIKSYSESLIQRLL